MLLSYLCFLRWQTGFKKEWGLVSKLLMEPESPGQNRKEPLSTFTILFTFVQRWFLLLQYLLNIKEQF